MRRSLILLTLCLLLPACALALDLSAYEIPDSENCSVTLLGGSRMLLRAFSSEANQPGWARLLEDGAAVQAVTLPSDPALSHIVFARNDGSLGAIACQKSYQYANRNGGYTLYDVQQGKLINGRAMPGEITNLIRLDDRFIGLREADGESAQFMLYDDAQTITLTGQLPYAHVYPLYSSLDGDALLLMLHCWDESNQQILVARITADHQVSWQLWLPYAPLGSYSMALPDGQGGAFLVASPEEDYQQKRLAHISSTGALEWEKTLSVPDRVLMIHAAVPQADGPTMLYGTAVANSQGICDAFALAVAPDGQLLSADLRDFSARGDMSFTCKLSPDGAVYAVSERGSRNCVAVPFSALPQAADPGFRLQ